MELKRRVSDRFAALGYLARNLKRKGEKAMKWEKLEDRLPAIKDQDGSMYLTKWPNGSYDVVSKGFLTRHKDIKLLWIGPLPELPKAR